MYIWSEYAVFMSDIGNSFFLKLAVQVPLSPSKEKGYVPHVHHTAGRVLELPASVPAGQATIERTVTHLIQNAPVSDTLQPPF